MITYTRIARRFGIAALWAGGVALLAPVASAQSLANVPPDRIFVHAIAEQSEKITDIDSLDWSGRNNRLLVDRRALSRFYSLYTMTPEGFRLQSVVLAKPGNMPTHAGGGSWHPSGEYFIFTAQKQGLPDHARAVPRVGWHNDLWLGTTDGSALWQLTNTPSQRNAPTGAVYPSFSPDGTKIFWAGTTGRRSDSPWNQRSLFIADFAFENNAPKLDNIQEFQPGENRDFYEPYGFSPDGNRVLFAGNLVGGNPWFDLDIYAYDRRGPRLVKLTDAPRVWNRFATYSPDGGKIVWTSSGGMVIRSLGPNGERWERYLRSELWIMDENGRRAKQLTFFNTAGHPHFVGKRVFVGDSAFSPDGRYLAVVLYQEGSNFDPESRIVMLKLGDGPPAKFEWKTGGEETPAPAAEPDKPAETAPVIVDPDRKPAKVTW